MLTAWTTLYRQAIGQLHITTGWKTLGAEQQDRVMEPLVAYTVGHASSQQSIPKLRADVNACSGRRDQATESLMRIGDGQRVLRVRARDFFQDGNETEEQLEAALIGLRERCAELIGAGQKVLVQ